MEFLSGLAVGALVVLWFGVRAARRASASLPAAAESRAHAVGDGDRGTMAAITDVVVVDLPDGRQVACQCPKTREALRLLELFGTVQAEGRYVGLFADAFVAAIPGLEDERLTIVEVYEVARQYFSASRFRMTPPHRPTAPGEMVESPAATGSMT